MIAYFLRQLHSIVKNLQSTTIDLKVVSEVSRAEVQNSQAQLTELKADYHEFKKETDRRIDALQFNRD